MDVAVQLFAGQLMLYLHQTNFDRTLCSMLSGSLCCIQTC